MATETTNYKLLRPVVGGDVNTWGGFVNQNADLLEKYFTNSFDNPSLDPTTGHLGTLKSARVAGVYDGITGVGALDEGSITSGFGSIDIGSDNLSAGKVYAAAGGSTTTPVYSFTGHTGNGLHYLTGDSSVNVVVGGNAILKINAGQIVAVGAAVFSGSGFSLTDLDADEITSGTLNAERLPEDTAARTWVQNRLLAMAAGGTGTYAFMRLTSGGSKSAGDVVNGSTLAYSSAGTIVGIAPSTSTWRCMGRADSGAADVAGRTTLWQRVT